MISYLSNREKYLKEASIASQAGGGKQAYVPPSMRAGATQNSSRPGSKFSDFGKGPGGKGLSFLFYSSYFKEVDFLHDISKIKR